MEQRGKIKPIFTARCFAGLTRDRLQRRVDIGQADRRFGFTSRSNVASSASDQWNPMTTLVKVRLVTAKTRAGIVVVLGQHRKVGLR